MSEYNCLVKLLIFMSKPIILTNLIRMRIKPNNNDVYIYSISILPEIPLNSVNVSAIYKQLNSQLVETYKKYYIYSNNLFSTKKVEENISFEISIRTRIDNSSNSPSSDSITSSLGSSYENNRYTITISPTKSVIDLTNTTCLLPSYKSFIEKIIKNTISNNKEVTKFRNNAFFNINTNNREYIKIRGLEKNYIISGYETSVFPTQKGITLKIVNKNKFVNGFTCKDIIDQISRKNSNKPEKIKEEIEDTFMNKTIIAKYGSNATYQVIEIDFRKRPSDIKFNMKIKNDQILQVNLIEYYKKQYNMTISNDQFLLKCSKIKGRPEDIPKEKIVDLIPELCLLTGMTSECRENEDLKREMISLSKIPANKKMDKTLKFFKMLSSSEKRDSSKLSPKEIIEEWGLQYKASLLEVEGKYLEKPKIKYEDGFADFTNGGKFRHRKIIETKQVNDKSVLFISNKKNKLKVSELIDSFIKCSKQIGLFISNDLHKAKILEIEHFNDNLSDWINLTRKAISEFKKEDLFFIFVVDRQSKSFYPQLKNILKENGIKNQFINVLTLNKGLSPVSNILLQIIEKLGGKTYHIEINKTLQEQPSVIVGIETTSSSLSLTMSYDKNFSKYYSEYHNFNANVSFDKTCEMITELMAKLLLKIKERFKRSPKFMIIYRSGKNESGIKLLQTKEIPIINDLITKFLCETQMIYIVSVKKPDINLYEKIREDEFGYPMEGLCIDSCITNPEILEFYLQSPSGTGLPLLFKCIDVFNWKNELKIEDIENITYRLCYYYANWSGPIKVPSVLKHAEKVIFSNNLSKTAIVNSSLEDSPYYI